MMDMFSRQKRSSIMRRIKSADTEPEKAVRRLLHAWGYRFRLHRRDLPGCPDIVLPKFRIVLLVHGCFWHGHRCQEGRRPKSHKSYWNWKLDSNKARDRTNRRRLRDLGWKCLVIWACQIENPRGIAAKLDKAVCNR